MPKGPSVTSSIIVGRPANLWVQVNEIGAP